MTQVLFGERIGKTGNLRTGCSAVLFDPPRQKILLTRRADNSQWCLPGGGMETGEDARETCEREFYEETGLKVRVVRLLGIYSSPNWVIQYTNGGRFQVMVLNFEVEQMDGELTLNEEVTEFGYFTQAETQSLDLFPHHHERIADAFNPQGIPYIR